MSHAKAIITTLVALLVITNAWWAYRLLDSGISFTYQKASLDKAAMQLAVAKAVISAVVKDGYTKEGVIRAARVADQNSEPFEKDGAVWVGQLGLHFNADGRLAKVVTTAEDTQ
jgi:hypothetical protein